MKSSSMSFAAVAAVAAIQGAAAGVSLTAQPFLLTGESTASNAKLSWSQDTNAASYLIQRSIGSSPFTDVGIVPGNSYDDYGLPSGNVTYQISSLDSSNHSTGSISNAFDVYLGESSPASFGTYSNLQASSLARQSHIQVNGVYYSYNTESNAQGLTVITEQTSSDGYSFSGDRVVLTSSQVCAGSSTGGCKLERQSFQLNPQTNEVVMWAHWENNVSYSLAEVAVAFGQPGGSFSFGGSFRPLGNDSRDLSFFVDDDSSGYLFSATRVNSDMAIYALTPNWHNISSKVATVLQDQHREAPSVVKVDGYYYLFTSTAAGWYPSTGEYISATAIAGPWSASQNIGDLATFAAQSGGVSKVGSQYAMLADRWAANWKNKEPNNREIMLPITFANGHADYHFYDSVQHSDVGSTGNILGVQTGKIVSTNRPVTASPAAASHPASMGNDGISLVTTNYYQPAKVPFTYEISLASATKVTQLDLSTRLFGGSETYYNYTVDCLNNGVVSTQLVDMTANTVVGFTTSQISATNQCTSVRLNVNKVVNVQNGNEADWAAGIVEFVVYGS